MGNKRIRNREQPAHKKSIATEAPGRSFSQKISWRFSHMDNGGRGKCSFKLLHDYAGHFHRYEKLSRDEIEGKAHCHPLNPAKLSDVGQCRIQAIGLEVDTLYQLDFATPCRLWGFWTENVFNVVWLDQDHSFYTCT